MDKTSPIGVFDSGLGGISVLAEIHKQLPHEDLLYIGDSIHNPYGTKSEEELLSLCLAICDELMEANVKMIVIACNTATSACVNTLRKKYPIDIVGMEPALKVAADQDPKQSIAVWATDFTLKEKKFADLMDRFKDSHTIYKVPSPQLVRLVEEDRLSDEEAVDQALEDSLARSHQADSIVLGCTHFVFYKEHLKKKLPNTISILDGNEGTAHHVRYLLEEKGLLNCEGGSIEWRNTMPEKIEQAKQLYQRMEESQ